jgi:hypothetical protein
MKLRECKGLRRCFIRIGRRKGEATLNPTIWFPLSRWPYAQVSYFSRSSAGSYTLILAKQGISVSLPEIRN